MQNDRIYRRLAEQIPAGRLIPDCDMRMHTTFKAGGKAALFVLVENREELGHALNVLSDSSVAHMVVGNGSNILVTDAGYAGVLIKLGGSLAAVAVADTGEDVIVAGAGALLSEVAKEAMDRGLSGLEFAFGIPGTVGGALYMNAGAYGNEMRDVVESVEVLAADGKHAHQVITAAALEWGYRSSALQQTGDVVIGATLRLAPGDPVEIKGRVRELTQKRNAAQPLALPSAGSFFKRPEGFFAGKLIQDAGLKGVRIGDARVSPQHAGFIVNEGTATAADIIDLMHLIQNTVLDKFGVSLAPEVQIIGE